MVDSSSCVGEGSNPFGKVVLVRKEHHTGSSKEAPLVASEIPTLRNRAQMVQLLGSPLHGPSGWVLSKALEELFHSSQGAMLDAAFLDGV